LKEGCLGDGLSLLYTWEKRNARTVTTSRVADTSWARRQHTTIVSQEFMKGIRDSRAGENQNPRAQIEPKPVRSGDRVKLRAKRPGQTKPPNARRCGKTCIHVNAGSESHLTGKGKSLKTRIAAELLRNEAGPGAWPGGSLSPDRKSCMGLGMSRA
jgi:hypothetical protein